MIILLLLPSGLNFKHIKHNLKHMYIQVMFIYMHKYIYDVCNI